MVNGTNKQTELKLHGQNLYSEKELVYGQSQGGSELIGQLIDLSSQIKLKR